MQQSQKETEELNRDRLLSGFLAAVKVCQVRYGGRTELATEGDPRVATLCQCLEETLTHGLRTRIPNRGIGAIRQVTDLVSSGLNLHLTLGSNEPGTPVLWWYVRELLTRHEYDRFLLLRNVISDEGRGRAWLRSLLNEHSLERYIHIMLSDQSFLELWYEPWALLRDQERSAMLPNLAAGLDSILFAINIDNEIFNTGAKSSSGKELSEGSKRLEPEPQVAQLADHTPPDTLVPQRKVEVKKKKRKIPSQLVSFDEDALVTSTNSPTFFPAPPSGYFSAPTTCVSSPTAASRPGTTPYADTMSQLVAEQELEEAKRKLQNHSTATNQNQPQTTLKPLTTLPIWSEASNEAISSRSLTDNDSVNVGIEPSYSQVLEDLLASQSFSYSGTSVRSEKKTQERTLTKSDQETGSLRSGLSDVSGESVQSSEGETSGLPSLIPLDGGVGGAGVLIPLSPDGEVLFDVSGAPDDVASLRSSEDEFDANDCCPTSIPPPPKTCEKTDMSSSTSMASMASGGSVLSIGSKCSTVTPSSFSSLTFDELRTAVLEISRARDACEQRSASVAQALNVEMETSSTLRAQLTHEQTQHKESVDRLTSKVNALTRENELLRHQLKKYIGAVQMLRRDTENHEVDNLPPPSPRSRPPEIRDYHDEAAAYEGKLIQVAEMHGELMEFNERLQRLLKFRESQVHRLKEELVELRGPLPEADNEDDFDETASMTSDLDSLSSPRTLINIWIPTAFLAGPSSDTHHVYQIYVRIKDDEWNVYRRFAQFYELHRQFKKKDPVIRTFDFPQKKTFGYKDISVVENRRLRLQQYVRQLVNFLVSSDPSLASHPSKSSLTSLLPFLLDSAPPKETSIVRGQNKRRFLSRLSARQEAPPSQPSPQYNGL